MQPLTVFFLNLLVAAALLLKLSQSLQHTPSTLIALLGCIRASNMYSCTHQSYEHRRLPLLAVRIRRPLGLQLPAESICLRLTGAQRSLYCYNIKQPDDACCYQQCQGYEGAQVRNTFSQVEELVPGLLTPG